MFRGGRGGQFQKPENALKRAEELINVGQKPAALQALHDVITSKRYRTWQKTMETIMLKYIDLCVELKKGRFAKDGLIHYRNLCQNINVGSLEEVIKYFLQVSLDKAEDAQKQADVSRRCCLPAAYDARCTRCTRDAARRNACASGPPRIALLLPPHAACCTVSRRHGGWRRELSKGCARLPPNRRPRRSAAWRTWRWRRRPRT